MLNRGLDKLELLRIVEAVANEKSIDKELVIGSMESAIQKAALTKFGNDNNIEVIIDRESGDIKIQKVLEIVEKVEDSSREITLDDAKKIKLENNEFSEIIHCDFLLLIYKFIPDHVARTSGRRSYGENSPRYDINALLLIFYSLL